MQTSRTPHARPEQLTLIWKSELVTRGRPDGSGGAQVTAGPALTITGIIPDLDHFKDSFGGRVFPLWADAQATRLNLKPALLAHLSTPDLFDEKL